MPFVTGTAETPSVLMNAMNTHLVANGWTKVQGNEDLRTDSPISARYWRIKWLETEDTNEDFRGTSGIELRTTVGGPNVATVPANGSASAASPDGDFGDVFNGQTRRSNDINDDPFWIQYDFGTATVVREVEFIAAIDDDAPRDVLVQFSTDGVTWTNAYREVNMAWTDGQTRTWTFDDGAREQNHAGLNQPRKTGRAESTAQSDEQSEDVFVWQGPGYDAARRVYVAVRGQTDLVAATHRLEMYMFISYDPLLPIDNQEGSIPVAIYHLMSDQPVTYWLYSNSIRMVLVTLNGVSDYTSMYAGFMAAFGTPDEYPQPLFLGGTSDGQDAVQTVRSDLSSFCDPGDDHAYFRRFDSFWLSVDNRSNSNNNDDYNLNPVRWTWPYLHGTQGQSQDWPFNPMGTNGENGNHWLDHFDADVQGNLPLLPVTVVDELYGAVGVLDGVFAVPSGGLLSPQQVINISGQDYRVFPNRERRQGHHWFAIRED